MQRLTSRAVDLEAVERNNSFINVDTGEKEDTKKLWESSSWAKLEQKKGKFMEKSLSFIGSRSAAPSKTEGAVVIVDPFSTGAHLASAVCDAGLKCIRLVLHF